MLGNSFGGMVAMSYATRHPDHPAKLVLSSTAAVSRRDRSLEMFQKRGGAEAREAAQRFFDNPGAETADDFQKKCLPLYNRVPSGPEFTKRSVMNLELMVDYFKHESHMFNFLPDLGRIKCPTLITVGDLDPILPVADSQDIAAAMAPGVARLEVFENAGHGVYRDEPDRFFKMFNEFLLA